MLETAGAHVYRSRDGGRTWTLRDALVAAAALCAAVAAQAHHASQPHLGVSDHRLHAQLLGNAERLLVVREAHAVVAHRERIGVVLQSSATYQTLTVTESLETWIDEMQPDMMIRSKEVPPYVRVGRTRVVSGKMDDLKALFRDQIVPAVKKSGATDYGVAVARFGTPSNELHSYLGLNGWGELDGPIGVEKAMSASEFKAFQAKLSPLIESTEWSMWKYEPEVSYILPAK